MAEAFISGTRFMILDGSGALLKTLASTSRNDLYDSTRGRGRRSIGATNALLGHSRPFSEVPRPSQRGGLADPHLTRQGEQAEQRGGGRFRKPELAADLVRRYGLKELRYYDLRHDAASTLTMAGVAQPSVMEILGHHDARMTLRS